jgi:hypothetical protein
MRAAFHIKYCNDDGLTVYQIRFSRIRRLGISKLQLDDYLMVNAGLWYTMLCISLNMIASGGGSNLMSQEDIDNLTPKTIADRVTGSKWVFVSEQSMLIAIWSMKCCMLLIYSRLTYVCL